MHNFVYQFLPEVGIGGGGVVDTFQSGIGIAEIAHNAEGLACGVALGGSGVILYEIGVYAQRSRRGAYGLIRQVMVHHQVDEEVIEHA